MGNAFMSGLSAIGPREETSGGARSLRCSQTEEGLALDPTALTLYVPQPFSSTKPRVLLLGKYY